MSWLSRAVVAAISAATVWRILDRDAIRPWFHRSWIFPRAQDFAAEAAVVLDLYARIFEGKALGEREFVICADEKTRSRPAAAVTRPCRQGGRA